MKDEISRVLTLVEEGKIEKEKATELINALQGKQEPVLLKKDTPYLNKTLKIRVNSEDGDHVNVNLPIKLIKALLRVGANIAEKIPESSKYVKDIDIELLIQAIEHEVDGQIIDITSSKGDKVLVVIE